MTICNLFNAISQDTSFQLSQQPSYNVSLWIIDTCGGPQLGQEHGTLEAHCVHTYYTRMECYAKQSDVM